MFGWKVSSVTEALPILLIVGVLLLLMDMGLTAPITLIDLFFGKWLTSDKTAFLKIFVFALGFTIFITWIHIFVRGLVLLAAGTLFRLDLQQAKFKRWQSLMILLLTCVISYTIGVVGHAIMEIKSWHLLHRP